MRAGVSPPSRPTPWAASPFAWGLAATALSLAIAGPFGASSAAAQDTSVLDTLALDPDDTPSPRDPTYASLTADDRAQMTLGGFRGYLERIRPTDEALYLALDPRLDDLESRDETADIVFWTATSVALATVVAGIPVYEMVAEDIAIGLFIAGASTFALAVILQAILRPGLGDLFALIDEHDHRVGRR